MLFTESVCYDIIVTQSRWDQGFTLLRMHIPLPKADIEALGETCLPWFEHRFQRIVILRLVSFQLHQSRVHVTPLESDIPLKYHGVFRYFDLLNSRNLHLPKLTYVHTFYSPSCSLFWPRPTRRWNCIWVLHRGQTSTTQRPNRWYKTVRNTGSIWCRI